MWHSVTRSLGDQYTITVKLLLSIFNELEFPDYDGSAFLPLLLYDYYHYYYNKHLSDEIMRVQSDMHVDDKLLINQGNETIIAASRVGFHPKNVI